MCLCDVPLLTRTRSLKERGVDAWHAALPGCAPPLQGEAAAPITRSSCVVGVRRAAVAVVCPLPESS